MVVCCLGHGLLLALGFAGLGAAAGAITGSTALLVLAAGVLVVLGAVVVARARRGHHTSDADRVHRGRNLP
jgi:hypothetical protein